MNYSNPRGSNVCLQSLSGQRFAFLKLSDLSNSSQKPVDYSIPKWIEVQISNWGSGGCHFESGRTVYNNQLIDRLTVLVQAN